MYSDNVFSIKYYDTRTITPENPTGEKGKAAMLEPLSGTPGEMLGKGWKSRPFITIMPHTTIDLADIHGEGMIKSMWITGEVDRGLILRMFWDEYGDASVEVPLTDFFLYGWSKPHFIEDGRWNAGPDYKVNSDLIVVNPNRGLNSFIPMPYRKSAHLTLENRTSVAKVIYYQINYEKRKVPEDAGYFHAQFRASLPVKYKEVHTLLDDVRGKGTYLGTALYVGLNRTSRWWGEGEIKFYIDGDDEYPTYCSTGLEDYFGGAFNWDCEDEYRTYSTKYMGMTNIVKPDGLYEVQQRFSMYRWHVVDPIKFKDSLKVTIQALGWKTDDHGKIDHFLPREDDYMSVSYWYQEKLGCKFPKLISHDELTKKF